MQENRSASFGTRIMLFSLMVFIFFYALSVLGALEALVVRTPSSVEGHYDSPWLKIGPSSDFNVSGDLLIIKESACEELDGMDFTNRVVLIPLGNTLHFRSHLLAGQHLLILLLPYNCFFFSEVPKECVHLTRK